MENLMPHNNSTEMWKSSRFSPEHAGKVEFAQKNYKENGLFSRGTNHSTALNL
jgi:hypothetical protein